VTTVIGQHLPLLCERSTPHSSGKKRLGFLRLAAVQNFRAFDFGVRRLVWIAVLV
jgi:hypothetical protein